MVAGSPRMVFSPSAEGSGSLASNATMEDPNKPAFAANYFTGVPAPMGRDHGAASDLSCFPWPAQTAGDADRHLYLADWLF